MKRTEDHRFVKKVIDDLISEDVLAVGIFGSSAYHLKEGSDVDMYVLAENSRSRTVTERGGYMFEIYHADPEVVRRDIASADIRTVARMRSSRPFYDPRMVYKKLIRMANEKNLRHPAWVEETIIGGTYDMVERTEESVEKELRAGRLISAASSIRYLIDRIMDVGFRRLNMAIQAKPERVPELVKLLPEPTQAIYEETFKGVDTCRVESLMKLIKDEKRNLFPKIE